MTPRTRTERQGEARGRLSRERALRAAVGLADRDGLEALTMRRLAQELRVEAMSLYHHVANKEAILDGAIEVVVDEINAAVADVDGPSPSDDWQAALRARILAARQVLLRHPWAPRVLETRTGMSPAIIGYFDGVLGILRAGGFSYDLAHHAMHVLGSRALTTSATARYGRGGGSSAATAPIWPRSGGRIVGCSVRWATSSASWRRTRWCPSTCGCCRPGATTTSSTHSGELIEAGELTPVIDRTYPLAAAAEAMEYLGAGHARVKVIVTIQES